MTTEWMALTALGIIGSYFIGNIIGEMEGKAGEWIKGFDACKQLYRLDTNKTIKKSSP